MVGVYKKIGKYKDSYISSIRFNKETIYLGSFDTKEEAQNAFLKAYKELHGFERKSSKDKLEERLCLLKKIIDNQ